MTRALVLAVALAMPALARAQQVRGEVMLPDSATRVRGIVVIAADAKGATVGRALTGERGEFTLALPGAGRYSVRALRVGFRPTTVPPFDLAAGEVSALYIVLRGESVALAPVRVRGDNVCHMRDEAGKAVLDLWDQVRTALSATQLTSAGEPLVASLFEYTRVEGRTTHLVQSEKSTTKRGPTTHAFVSVAADTLAKYGYVVDDQQGASYYAPDPDVLMSESFVSRHCFHVEPPPPSRAEWVGIGFVSPSERPGVHDIEGTLWLDRATAQLRRLDYLYTNVDPEINAAGAGGFVDFLPLSTGQWIVSSWAIRMPLAYREAPIHGPAHVVVRDVQVAGGDVLEVTREGTTLHRAPGARVELRVSAHDAAIVAPGTRIIIAGTQYLAVADSTGHARFEGVLPGMYTVRLLSPSMERIGAPSAERTFSVARGAASVAVTLELPGSDEVVRGVCDDSTAGRESAVIGGVLRDAAGQPAARAMVDITWLGEVKALTDAQLLYHDNRRQVASDGEGRWLLCNVPRDVPLNVTVTNGGTRTAPVTVRVPPGWRIARFDLPQAKAQRP